MPQNKDSLLNTFLVAGTLCLACAALVSSAAVFLKPIMNDNILLDKRTNILKVAGFTQEDIDKAGGVNQLFEDKFTTIIIDLDSGQEALEDCEAAVSETGKQFANFKNDYDQIWCSQSKKTPVATELSKKEDICGIKWREKFSHVYLLRDSETGPVKKYVFPVRSYGLWSMMKGYMAVEPDLQTVAGLTFYEQAETPGLGGEITNPQWKKKWVGKEIFEGDQVALTVTKAAEPGDEHAIDALSGATITSNGVSNLVEFWMGSDGFGPFIENRKGSQTTESASNKTPATSGVNHG